TARVLIFFSRNGDQIFTSALPSLLLILCSAIKIILIFHRQKNISLLNFTNGSSEQNGILMWSGSLYSRFQQKAVTSVIIILILVFRPSKDFKWAVMDCRRIIPSMDLISFLSAAMMFTPRYPLPSLINIHWSYVIHFQPIPVLSSMVPYGLKPEMHGIHS